MSNGNVLYSEIFAEFGKAYTRDARIAVLRKYGNSNVWFREFLNYAFNPKIQFDIDKIPDYKPAVEPAGLNFTYLNGEMRRLYIFIVGHPKRTAKLDPRKEERILNALLGALHKDEADLLVRLFSKKLGIKYLSPRLVKEAFPQMPYTVEEPVATTPIIVKGEEIATIPAKKSSKAKLATVKV
jgi:hypothetical protein